ncbi:hypothetical protein [Streptomyces phytophilus]|uniref:hypothetical protein n=1 Tax=Streptomyces phytophilus TaxID=722715 RepID=UPI0015F12255|nr:hypothetical protein [Streptomyces phytophilus]
MIRNHVPTRDRNDADAGRQGPVGLLTGPYQPPSPLLALAGTDPASVVLHVDGRAPEELAEEIIRTVRTKAAEMALQT